MIGAWVLLVWLSAGHPAQSVRFSVIEHNQMGPGNFEQIIVWDSTPHLGLVCQGWISADDCRQMTHRPPYRFRIVSGLYAGIIIEAPIYRQTITERDPEVVDRARWPIDCRRRWADDAKRLQFGDSNTGPR